MDVRREGGLGSFQLEPPAEREADGQVDKVVAIPDIESPTPTVSAPSSGKLSL